MKADFVENEKIYLVTKCERCGETAFRKYLSTKELDGGFTEIEEFEKLPDGWKSYYEAGMLCPECRRKFDELIKNFMELAVN